jgi:hypothetical protein
VFFDFGFWIWDFGLLDTERELHDEVFSERVPRFFGNPNPDTRHLTPHMKLHEIHCHFQAEVIVWWEWLPATIMGFAKSSSSRLEAAPTTYLSFFFRF